jgi:hypothetical protein
MDRIRTNRPWQWFVGALTFALIAAVWYPKKVMTGCAYEIGQEPCRWTEADGVFFSVVAIAVLFFIAGTVTWHRGKSFL